MLKKPLLLIVPVLVLLLANGCGTAPVAAPTQAPASQAAAATQVPAPTAPPPPGGPLQQLGAGEGEVSIVAWAGYIERGESDKNYDWVTGFEKDSGCKVTVKTAATSDEMVALMNEGGFDLVTASGDASLRLVAGNRVQEVN